MRLRAAALAVLALAFGAPCARAAALPAPFVTPAAASTATVTWSWPLTANATGYRVLYSSGGALSGDLPAATTFFALNYLSTNSATTVIVEAFGTGFTVGDSAASTAYTAAATPSGSQVLGSNLNVVTLSWLTNGNPAGTTYDVFWSTPGGTPVAYSTTPAVVAGSATATVPALPGGFQVYFQVLAVNGQGVQTPFDVVVTTYIPPLYGQPVISSATFALGVSSITWYWSPSTGAVNYQLFSTTGGAISPLLPPTQYSYIQTGLTANTSYMNYVTAYAVPVSTNSAPLARYTLAARSSGLTAAALIGAFENLAWNANGNPAYTRYDVSFWTGVTSTVTYSTTSLTTSAGVLPAGGTVYFTVRAVNGEGISADYDATLYGVVPSTYFAVGVTTIPSNYSGTLTFAVPTGAVRLYLSSGTFGTAAAVSIQTPSVVPAASGRLTPVPGLPGPGLPAGINFTITAYDQFGAPLQPQLPIAIAIHYVPAAVAGLDQTTLAIARYDTAHGAWVPLVTQRGGGDLYALTEHLTQFAVLSAAAPADLSSITVGPNPLRPVLNPGQVFTFRGLPVGTRVRVFTYVGERLAEITSDAAGLASWDGRNARGALVASGVYIAVIEGAGAKKTMRLAVER